MADKNLQITLDPAAVTGKYSNLAIIGHTETEFVLDFASMLPGQQNALVHSRIIMAPQHMKRLMFAINENVQKYEKQFGTIDNVQSMPMTFGGEA